MSGLRSRYAPVRSGVVGGYVSVDGDKKQVEYSGLGYLCTFAGGCLLFVLGVLGAIAFGLVLRNNSNLHELQKQVAELEIATPAPPAPVSDTSAFDALQSQLSDTQEGVSAVHSLYNSLVQQFGTLRENVFALRNGRGNDDDDSSSDDSSSDDFLGAGGVRCLDDSDCTVGAPCRQGECVPSGNGGRCVLSFSGQGTPCTVGSRTGTCGSRGQCIRGQGCVDAEAFEGWYTAQPTFQFWFYAPFGFTEIPTAYHITTQSCNATNFVLQMEFVYGTPKRSREATANDFVRSAPLLFRGGQQLAVVDESFSINLGFSRQSFLTTVDLELIDELGGATLFMFQELPLGRDGVDVWSTLLYPISAPTNIREPSDTTPPLLDRPMVQVEQFVDYMTEILPFTSSLIPEGGVTSQELHQIAQSLKSGPLGPFTAPATDVLKTRQFTSSGFTVPLTVFYTQKHLPINPASRVTLSGFTGNDEWATLNAGTFRVSPYFYILETENAAVTDAFYSEDSRRQSIVVEIDSRDFPVYNASIHGVPTLSYTVPRLQKSTEYLELLDILHYLKFRASPLGDTHAHIDVLRLDTFNFGSSTIPETYAQTQALIDAFGVSYGQSDSRGGSGESPNLYRTPSFGLARVLNSPFEDFGSLSQGNIPGNYDTTVFNYLNPSSLVWLWQRAVPNSPVTTRLHERIGEYGNLIPSENSYVAVTSASGLLNPGAPEGASEYEGFLGGPYTAGDGINPVTGSPDLKDEFGNFLFASPASDGRLRAFPLEGVAGVVRTDILGGRKFGYIRLGAMQFTDLLFTRYFLDTPSGDGFRFVWAQLIKYFNEYQEGTEPPGVEGIIIDIRVNFGGGPPHGLVECLGGDRFLGTTLNGNGDQLNNNEAHAYKVPYSGIRNVSGVGVTPEQPSDLNIRLRPSEIEAKIPGGTFKNGTVIVLTSTNAFSAGDSFQHTVLGENGDGNLGSTVSGQNVKVQFVGNMYALLLGGSAPFQRYSPGVSDQDSRLQTSDGAGVHPWRYEPERTIVYQLNATTSVSRLDAQGQPVSGMRPVNSNIRSALYNASRNVDTGVNGIHYRALSSELADVAYFDFGYTGPGGSFNGYKFADGHWDSSANAGPTGFQRVTQAGGVVFPDQPVADPNQASTWRDSWLEEALRVAQLYTYGNFIQDSGTPLPLAATTSSHNEAVSMLNDLTERTPHTVEIFEETAKEMGYEWEAIQQDPESYESVMRDLLKRVHYKLYVLHQ